MTRGATLTALVLDTACCNRANWRTDLPAGIDADSMVGLLIARGYEARCRHAALKVLRHSSGHELAWVIRTGRVQIRVDLAVPQGERRRRAQALHEDLASCLGQLRQVSPTVSIGGGGQK